MAEVAGAGREEETAVTDPWRTQTVRREVQVDAVTVELVVNESDEKKESAQVMDATQGGTEETE